MALFDPGLQPERTELAWRRTTLAVAVGSLVALRLLPDVFGHVLWVLPGALGLVASGLIWLAARRRYSAVTASAIEHGDRAPHPDGRLPLALAGFATAVGLLGLAIVAVIAAAR
ncbi:DUF202 domain-containing protein [Microbacterium thalassium]|uniref:Uncharacterized membrane protein YidH (DUF202 family) n=1 Tax=Microbacterium thalassium TaxID=362649 RepID=A0A7X0KW99_9MICO|nr:DUF202 domain-containing protein [Microbacterium thalassium]MBB6393075.1 uncharacterized membrane protein YidH (DUF202 family) [Microbacterium thalassium]GLK22694.1 hypothetical protein GCM10017607_00120 [Microbacterium thalassium]